jgi:hypothetical protein
VYARRHVLVGRAHMGGRGAYTGKRACIGGEGGVLKRETWAHIGKGGIYRWGEGNGEELRMILEGKLRCIQVRGRT